MNGQGLRTLRDAQDRIEEQRRKLVPPRYFTGNLGAARANYKKMLEKAIMGQQGPLFRNSTPTGSLVLAGFKSTTGDNLGSLYAAPNQSLISEARKQASDAVAASLFMHPSTDILAYHRRIEHPEVFTHQPTFGF
jgi:hypothetical protein